VSFAVYFAAEFSLGVDVDFALCYQEELVFACDSLVWIKNVSIAW